MENVINRAAELHQPHRADKGNEPGADDGEIAEVPFPVHVAVNYPAPFGDEQRFVPGQARNRAVAHVVSPPVFLAGVISFLFSVQIPLFIPSPCRC
jgi:hypothetical protein